MSKDFENKSYIMLPLDPDSKQMTWNMSCQHKQSNSGNCVGECRVCIDLNQFRTSEEFEELKIKAMSTFREPLQAIKNKNIYRWTIDMLAKLPLYFWTVPASSTGKYHPPSDQGDGGLIRHTLNVAWFAVEMLNNPLYKDIPQQQKDCIIAAALIHDGVKHGFHHFKYTQKDHPMLPEMLDLTVTKKEIETRSSVRGRIFRLVRSHMGPWTDNINPLPETAEEKILHFCDYLSSRRQVDIVHDRR